MTEHAPDQFSDVAQRAMAAMKVIDAAFREGSPLAENEFDQRTLREYRKLRRSWARFHAEAGEFADEFAPEVTAKSGGT